MNFDNNKGYTAQFNDRNITLEKIRLFTIDLINLINQIGAYVREILKDIKYIKVDSTINQDTLKYTRLYP
ncbi:hypothetical protein [Acholeplasma oculi]|uniref:hypothetical protein n=1 Tax=Acholeplasma oculi TaxID=35623 RepID=UPI0005F2E9AF|nr:hypothetical protein [Acholeplasma oculi]